MKTLLNSSNVPGAPADDPDARATTPTYPEPAVQQHARHGRHSGGQGDGQMGRTGDSRPRATLSKKVPPYHRLVTVVEQDSVSDPLLVRAGHECGVFFPGFWTIARAP